MRKAFSIILSLAAILFGAESHKLGGDTFTQGVGIGAGNSTYAPLVSDEGECLVIAPEPDGSDIEKSRGVWKVAGSEVTQVLDGYTEFFGKTATCAASLIQASRDFSELWMLSFDVDFQSYAKSHLWYSNASDNKSSSDYYDDDRTCDTGSFMPFSDGSKAFRYDKKKCEIVELNGEKLSNPVEIILAGDVGFRPAFARDGSAIYYIAFMNQQETGDGDSFLSLYRYDVASGETELVEEKLGRSRNLGLWNGVFLTDISNVVCSEDGSVVAYRWGNGWIEDQKVDGVQIRLARRLGQGSYAYEFASRTMEGENLKNTDSEDKVDCQEPAISWDGRYVAFRAKASNSPVPSCDAVFRRDVDKGTLEALSDASFVNGVWRPALSPNGRQAAFLGQKEPDDNPQLYAVDCGLAISLPASIELLAGSSAALDLKDNLTAGEKSQAYLTYTLTEASCTLSDKDGKELEAGKKYSYGSLPWTISAGNAKKTCDIDITMEAGGQSVQAESAITVINDFICVFEPSEGNGNFTSAVFSAQGTAALFVTDVQLTGGDTDASLYDDVYLLDMTTGSVECLTPNSAFSTGEYTAPQISGDGSLYLWMNFNSGELWKREANSAAASKVKGIFCKQVMHPIAVDFSGNGIACVTTENKLMISTDRGEYFSEVPIVIEDTPASVNMVGISPDGCGLCVYANCQSQPYLVFLHYDCQESRFEQDAFVQCGVRDFAGFILDGQSFIYQQESDRSWYRHEVAEGLGKRLDGIPVDANGVSFSNNGHYAYYTKDNAMYRLDLLRADASAECVTIEDCDGAVTEPYGNWNGSQVLFSSRATNISASQTGNGNKLMLYEWSGFQNRLPAIAIDEVSTDEDVSATWSAADFGVSDADGDAFMLCTESSETVLGTVELLSARQIRYTPRTNANGQDGFILRVFDGTGLIEKNINVDVRAVNDSPVWDENLPVKGKVSAGSELSCEFPASDVDGDALTYAIAGEEASMDPSSGKVVFRPNLDASGDREYTISCSDGVETIECAFTLTVTAAKPMEIPAGYLFGLAGGTAQLKGQSGEWYDGISGCWADVVEATEFAALSTPGALEVRVLCQTFGCAEIYVYDGSKYLSAYDGVLKAGQGFWVKPGEVDEGVVLSITPAASVPADQKFLGPTLPDAQAPDDLFELNEGVFRRPGDWKVGRGYFSMGMPR